MRYVTGKGGADQSKDPSLVYICQVVSWHLVFSACLESCFCRIAPNSVAQKLNHPETM